ncbi:MAG: polyphosphate glucokinase [Frankiales bacterium]|jgi:polyphosphate glucokinase|nr:polyphosphate glucokinase [Frankiales bacterium]
MTELTDSALLGPALHAGPLTLAFDIGGTGLKAAVLDVSGSLIGERVRVETTYPLPPDKMVTELVALASSLSGYDRVSAGFPGYVRAGKVLSAPHFITRSGPGTEVLPDLVRAWDRFDLAGALDRALGRPTRLANDADMQGSAVMSRNGVELVITLGTGVGTAVFENGVLTPHLELAHHPLWRDKTYNEYIGDAARKKIGGKRWNKRVDKTIGTLRALLFFDHLWIGGGNSTKVTLDLPADVSLVDNSAGLRGGIALWATQRT